MNAGQRARFWLPAAGLVAGGVLTWIGVARAARVPVLSLVDLGFHELGHLVGAPFSDVATAMAGSIAQVVVPLMLAVYFLLAQRDWTGMGLCLVWAGTSTRSVALYIADAPHRLLPLIGGDHDWAFILGRTGRLDQAGAIAGDVTTVATVLAIVGVLACAWAVVDARLSIQPVAGTAVGRSGRS